MPISSLFKCKECGSHTIIEIVTDATYSAPVFSFTNDWDEPVYGKVVVDDGEVLRYVCGECNATIGGPTESGDERVATPTALLEYLREIKEKGEK